MRLERAVRSEGACCVRYRGWPTVHEAACRRPFTSSVPGIANRPAPTVRAVSAKTSSSSCTGGCSALVSDSMTSRLRWMCSWGDGIPAFRKGYSIVAAISTRALYLRWAKLYRNKLYSSTASGSCSLSEVWHQSLFLIGIDLDKMLSQRMGIRKVLCMWYIPYIDGKDPTHPSQRLHPNAAACQPRGDREKDEPGHTAGSPKERRRPQPFYTPRREKWRAHSHS